MPKLSNASEINLFFRNLKNLVFTSSAKTEIYFESGVEDQINRTVEGNHTTNLRTLYIHFKEP